MGDPIQLLIGMKALCCAPGLEGALEAALALEGERPRVCRGTCASEGAFVTPLTGLLFLPRLPPPKLDKESSFGPTGVDCGLLDAMPNSLTATSVAWSHAPLPRQTSRPSQPSLKLPVANSRPRSSSSQLTETSRRLAKGWHSQPKRSFARTSFLTVLSQRAVANFTSRQAAGFPYCSLSSWLSLRLDCSPTKRRAGN